MTFLAMAYPEQPVGTAYETIRQRLVRFFKTRDAIHCRELADETLDRLGRRLAAVPALEIREPMRYVLGVARLAWLERSRAEIHRKRRLRRLAATIVIGEESSTPDLEPHMAVLQRCLDELSAQDRRLLLRYYDDNSERKRTATRRALRHDLGITPDLLRVRMYRLRLRLERRLAEISCVNELAA
jgi:hypothetical protein